MSNVINNVPELRFPEFSDNWKEYKLNQITNYVDYRGKTPEKTQSGVFLVTAKNIKSGFIDYKSSEEFIGVGDYDSVMSRGKPQIGDVLLTTEAPLGNVAQIDREDIALAQRVIKFRGKQGTNNTFIKHYFLNPIFQRLLTRKAIGTTVLGIQGKVLHKLPLIVPTEKEQQKIADFLSSVDKKIEQLTEKHRLLTEYKKGVMQQIFTQQIRFKDDNGNDYPEWEEVELGESLDYLQPTKYLVKDTDYSDDFSTPVLTAGKTFVLGYTNEKQGIFKELLPAIIFDDFTTAFKYVDFPFKAKSSAMKILIAKEGLNIKYIFEAMQTIRFEVGGHERHWISKFSKLPIPYPVMEEQQKIANFLTEIDQKIDQAWSTLEQTKAFKKGLLQKMFV